MGVHIGATWRIRWNDLFGGVDAGFRYITVATCFTSSSLSYFFHKGKLIDRSCFKRR